MAKSVNTGWRAVTPGTCGECGSDDEYGCDGSGHVACACSEAFDESYDTTEAKSVATLPRVSLFQSAMRMRLTYGVLPTYDEFVDAFAGDLGEGGVYQIRNCKRCGNVDLTCDELWEYLNGAVAEFHDAQCDDTQEWAGDWASAVLQTLGIEWV